MRKYGTILFILIFATFVFGGCSSNKTIAVVNGENLTGTEFYKQLEIQHGKEVLDRMINDLLISQEAKKQGISVTNDDIEKELVVIKEQYGTEEAFNKALKDYNLSLADLKESIKDKVLFDKLATKDVKITEEEIKKYFEENKETFDQQEQVRASHILLESREEAENILKQLNEGADFAKLAQEKSIDDYSKSFGGDLNYFGRGEMVPEFEEVAFSLEKEQIGPIVESEYGYHIIKVIDKKPAKEANFEEVKNEIEYNLKLQSARIFEEVVGELRNKANIEIKWGNKE